MFFDKKISGSIGFYNLVDWWTNTFSKEERKIIEDTYKPLGMPPDRRPLTEGSGVTTPSFTKAYFLTGLAVWFNNLKYRYIANKMVEKAEQYIGESPENVLNLHFTYSTMITIYYPQRDDPEMFKKAVEACKKQIEMASDAIKAFKKEHQIMQQENQKLVANPLTQNLKIWNGKEYVSMKDINPDSELNSFHLPSHQGYEQLVIILNKQGNNEEAIKMCEQAKAQGWSGDWDKRIARYKKLIC